MVVAHKSSLNLTTVIPFLIFYAVLAYLAYNFVHGYTYNQMYAIAAAVITFFAAPYLVDQVMHLIAPSQSAPSTNAPAPTEGLV